MTWLNPWAWLGIATLVLPILIHLLGRGPTQVIRFPSLRFIDGSKWLPAHRTRLQDPLLLAVRLLILLAAVAALAQPLRQSPAREQALDRMLSRVVILDTSSSMRRTAVRGGSVAELASGEATRLLNEADAGLILRTASPGASVHDATEWLRGRGGRTEVAIVSDFQRGTVDSAVLATIPAATGRLLVAIPVIPSNDVVRTTRQDGALVTARARVDSTSTTVSWDRGPLASTPPSLSILGETNTVEAVFRAASSIGMPSESTSRAVVVLLPGHAERAALTRSASVPREEWMLRLLSVLRRASLLDDAQGSGVTPISLPVDSALWVVRSATGATLVSAWVGAVDDRQQLVLDVHVPAGSVLPATLVAVASRALAESTLLSEWEPLSIPPPQLAAWQRAPAARGSLEADSDPMTGPSDGRWLWVVALVLLGAEFLVRGQRAAPIAGADASG